MEDLTIEKAVENAAKVGEPFVVNSLYESSPRNLYVAMVKRDFSPFGEERSFATILVNETRCFDGHYDMTYTDAWDDLLERSNRK